MGRGFVNAVDDFRADNPPSHPKTLDFLADEFVASGYDFRHLVETVMRHRRLSAGPSARYRAPLRPPGPEKAFTATPVRRMVGEALFDSIVQAGHLFDVKHRPGENMTTVVTYVRGPGRREGRQDPRRRSSLWSTAPPCPLRSR